VLVLCLPGSAAAATKSGQSPDCERFCMTVEPREGAEGTVFKFTGRHWRPNRRVRINFGVYCPPNASCIDILYFAFRRTDDRGRFTFRLRAGQEQSGDSEHGIRAGGQPTFQQRVGPPGARRTVSRRPSYRVTQPAG
jgi:hypothetical protein